MHYILFIPPPWVWLNLLSTFVLTPFTLLQKKTQTSFQTTLSRGTVLHPTLPVVSAMFEMLSLAQYSEPELDPMWVVLWCITVAFLILIIVFLECPPPRRFVR